MLNNPRSQTLTMKIPNNQSTERLGVALTEVAFTRLGFAFRPQDIQDVGIDAHAELIDNHNATGQILALQIKAGPSFLKVQEEDCYVFRTDSNHVDYWCKHALPVLICLCDVETQQVYWQRVSQDTAISTGKQYKIKVPQSQRVDNGSKHALQDILTPIVPAQRYTIFKTDDVSHPGAKRYSFRVVLNGDASKAEVASIVQQVTREGRIRKYYRNKQVQEHWQDSDAHVVWVFVYQNAEDEKRNLLACRSMWVHDGLPEKFRPAAFAGENIGNNIILDWTVGNTFMSEHIAKNVVAKEVYLSRMHPLLDELKKQFMIVKIYLMRLVRSEIREDVFLSETHGARARIDEIDTEISQLPAAPFECADLDQELNGFVLDVYNVIFFYSERGLEKWNERQRLHLSHSYIEYANESLEKVTHELAKIH